jgi:hypothetical protein
MFWKPIHSAFVAAAISIRTGLAATLLVTLGLSGSILSQQPKSLRDSMWKKVDDAVQKGLPKSAIEALGPILQGALAEKAYPEAIKAIAKRVLLEGQIEGAKPEEHIARMKAEIDKAQPEMLSVMHGIQAQFYWSYFEQNRWRFGQRTATTAPPSEDFTTWDLPRLFAEIDSHYTKALANEAQLRAIPIATYDILFAQGTVPDTYRPSLFDFIAFSAINFYSAGEQAGAKAEDAFEIEASSPALGPVADFMIWKPNSTDVNSPKLKAIQLYQRLLLIHQDDADRSAYLDADLGRLQFSYANAVGEEKASRTKAALKSFAEAHVKHELSATARHRLGVVLQSENELVEAREVAIQGKNAFPQSVGGKLCANLILDIEAKNFSVLTERVWNDPLPMLRVSYRNIAKVYFRAVKVDWNTRFTQDRWGPGTLSESDRNQFVRQVPAFTWSADLPPTDDYRDATHDVPAPKELKSGYYFILASSSPDFTDKDNTISTCDVWVSNLAIVLRQSWGNGKLEGFVLNAKTGEPIANAKVRTFVRQERNNGVKEAVTVTTNANGLFSVSSNDRGIFLLASANGQELAVLNEQRTYTQQDQPTNFVQFVLFTDRSIYRPGQTIQFKGVCLLADTDKDKYATVPDRDVTVQFRDINGKEIEQLKLRSNAFGSFTGSFTAPRDRGTGSMQIVVDDGRTGSTAVSVEEYKRPKFLVALEPPKEAIKLNDEVSITGKATSYTGSAINGAKVRYRITRQVRWPVWFMACYAWRMPPALGNAQEISHGWTTTEADGSFKVTFTAKPDASVPETDEPSFNYQIMADVTDTTGETRTGTSSMTVGYTALQANVAAKEWLASDNDINFSVATTTLDGTGQSAKGTLKIYRLKEPASVLRTDLLGQRNPTAPRGRGRAPGRPVKSTIPVLLPDPASQSTWALADVASTVDFVTAADGKQDISIKLERGLYRAVLESQDKYGKPVKSELNIRVIDPAASKLGLTLPNILVAPKWELQPGEKLAAIWGTGYDSGRAFVEVEHRGKLLQSFWTKPGATQIAIAHDINESMRGGFTLRTTFVRENRAHLESRHIDVPWSNKELKLKWERFVSKLEPGRKETYTLTVSGPNASKAAAEMVAAMYDASLDAYLPHNWLQRFSMFRQDYSRMNSSFENNAHSLNIFRGQWSGNRIGVELRYRDFPAELKVQNEPQMYRMSNRGGMGGGGPGGPPMPASAMMMEGAPMTKPAMLGDAMTDKLGAADFSRASGEPPAANTSNGPDLNQVSARKNLNETAFFFPRLIADADGNTKLEFTMPEALTTWRFLGFAHDTELRSGYIEDKVITAKDLMIQPNPPRFLREGDVLEFSVKVSNQSAQVQSGRVALNLFDARDNQSVDTAYGNVAKEQSFEIAAGESKSYHWKLNVPDRAYPIIYKTVGATDKLSDGEEGMLPVLSKRILVTESMPLPIRGASTKEFEFKKLLESGNSDSLKHQSLTVQMVSQPAWYAVLALPYLMEFPHECSEQTFNRLYANHLAQHIANSDPKIRRVFDTWRNIQPEALDSPLSKNQDIKSVMIEETPWLRDADRESQSRRNVGILFDENRLRTEVERTMRKLTEMQRDNGMWPWFPGGPDNEYLSLYIVTGFGRMRNLGVPIDVAPAMRALGRLDAWMHERYDNIRLHSSNPEESHLTSTIAMYLYGRSFFLKDMPVAPEHQVALDYWKRQSKNHWLKMGNRQSEAHIAIGLQRLSDLETPQAIVKSLRERSVSIEEMGMFWRDTERSWWWYHAPIETQALMIEAFDEVANDRVAVEDCKVWLLKQKQTQDWKTTKATADAVYALLLRGDNLLGSDALVQVKLADQTIKPENVEAGTGYYEQKFVRGEIKPEFGKLTLTKTDKGISWGSVHWQYLEDIGKITPHDGTPLKLEKALFKKSLTKSGPVLEPIAGAVSIGEEVVCRITLRTDRDMEYVHMKDHRGSGTEPVSVLSQYRFQDGLAYYESTRDTASHFFIDYLPKGTYVFEYTVRVQHAGRYPTGMASIQCMYAPEFNSHSESIMLEVARANP